MTKTLERNYKNVEGKLAEANRRLCVKVSTPMTARYRPDLDMTQLLSDEQANYYQNLIGVLRWAVELGQIDIHMQVAILSSYLAQPRQGHLEAVFHIFAYLRKYKRSKVVFDDTCVNWGNKFQAVDWKDFYPEASEPIPPNVPEPCGVLLFVCRAPIIWYSKRQNTVEMSTFGSEFIAAKTATEMIQAL